MKKTINILLVAVLVLGTMQIILPFSVPGVVGPTPDDGVDGVQYILGDWDVNGTETYTDEEIVLTGNLYIHAGDTLNLYNVTIAMNCTAADGTYQIYVWGTLNISDGDGDPSTTYDRSNITDSPFDVDDRTASDYKYAIKVYSGASLSIENSIIREAGYSTSDYNYGLYAEWVNNINIQNCTIENGYFGLYFMWGNNFRIGYNEFRYCDEYALYMQWSSGAEVYNNVIHHNDFGAWLAKSDMNIYNNYIHNNSNVFNSENEQCGMRVQWGDRAKIYNNTLEYNGHASWGYTLHLVSSDDVELYNNTLTNTKSGAGYCALLEGGDNLLMYNNTIFDNQATALYLMWDGGDTRVFNNTIYNNSGYGTYIRSVFPPSLIIFKDNYLDNNSGMRFREVKSYNITNNIITNCTGTAIYADDMAGGNFSNNTISGAGDHFYLADSFPLGEPVLDTVLEITNCSCDPSKTSFDPDDDAELVVKNYLHLTVTDVNTIVPGAYIEIKNNTGITVFTGESDNNGQINFITLKNITKSPNQNISYDPYNITGTLDIYTAYGEIEPVMNVSQTVNVFFNVDLPPVSPFGLTAISNGTNVDLNWEPSPSIDKDHYLVYRNQTGSGWELVYDSSSSPGEELWTNWTDVNAASDWSSYRYYVTVVDLVAQESPPSNIARCGDWVVTSSKMVFNLTAPMNGSLIILPTGNLTLKNVKLQFNSSFNNEFGVEVQPGGKLWLLDNDDNKITTSDQTYFSAVDSNFSISFVMLGAELVMKNSRLDNCGSNTGLDYIFWDSELDGPDIMSVGDPSTRGLYISPSGSSIVISDNEFNNNFVTILLNSVVNSTITGNTYVNNVFDIYLSDSHSNILNSNTHTSNTGFPMYIMNSEGNTITQNTITNPSNTEAGLAMMFDGSILNIITNNDFSGGLCGIITLSAGVNNNISSNNFTNQVRGIYLRSTSSTSLFFNDFDTIDDYDCYLTFSSWNTIIDSTSNQGDTGYYLQNSHSVDISGIQIENATGTGVYLSSSNNFDMNDVTIKSCTTGVRFISGINIFMENIQIEDCTTGIDISSNPINIMLENSRIEKDTVTTIKINTIDNFVIDNCFLNATTNNFDLQDATVTSYNTSFNQTKITLDSTSSIILWWLVNVRVYDWQGNPQAGAAVQIRQAAGTLIYDGSTDASGYTGEMWILERIQFKYFKESYTPHSFHAQYGTHSGDDGLKLNQSTLVPVWLENIGPTASNVAISPPLPTTISTLSLSYLYTDPENDPEGNTMILWYIDGVHNVSFNNLTTISSSFTTKDQTWFCEVVPHDGTTYGPPMTSTPQTIQNTPPEVTNVAILEAAPISSENLHVTYDFSDTDNDGEINSQYRWWVDNGTGFEYSGVDSLELSSSNTKKGEIWKCIVTPNDGDDFGSSLESNNVTIGNSPPEVFNVVILPENPQSNETLSVSYSYFDLDSDGETGSTIEWYKDGVPQPGLINNPFVDSSLTQKYEVWYYIITPSDGDDFGAPVMSDIITIGNTPPSVSGIVIAPSIPNTLDDLSVTYDFYDYDSDLESLDTVIKWLRWSGSDFFDTGFRGQNLSSEHTSKNESWKCEIIPHDGKSEGVATRSPLDATIVNSPPSVENAYITPENPTAESNLTANYDYSDPDFDMELGSTIRWYKDGVEQWGLNDSTQVAFSLTKKGEIWYFVVTPSDGEDIGSLKQSVSMTIGNTPPIVSNIVISPSNPITSDDLSVTYDYFDLDGDSESLDTVIKWLKWSGGDFFDTGLRGKNLSSEHIHKGEEWKCEVIPHDGESEGSAVLSSMSVVVGNSPPEVDNAVITPSNPDADTNLSTNYDYIDPDSDSELGSTIRWFKDGIEQWSLNDTWQVNFLLTLKGEIWHYVITPSDGLDTGSSVQSAPVSIGNTPPYVDNIIISPLNPDTSMDLTVTYDFYDSDGDSESLDTVVKWLRWDGADYFDTGHRGKTLSAVNTARGENWTCEIVPHDGFNEGNATRSSMNVTIGNSPPSASNAVVTPAKPGSDVDLIPVYDFFDPDFDSESGSSIRWYKDGILQTGLNDTFSVNYTLTNGNDQWYYIITPSDGNDSGTPVQSSTVTIGNTPPTVSNIIISPSNPITSDDLTVTYDFYDYDGDSESLDTIVRWLRWSGGVFFDTGLRGKTLSSGFTSKGEIWMCEVIPHDGVDEGSPTLSGMNVTIGNSGPAVTNCVISPESPDADSDLSVSYLYTDPDSDSESGSRIRWYKDDVLQPGLNDSQTVNYTLTLKGEKWYYIITPSDGEDFGVAVQSVSEIIGNTPPTVSNIVISPANPITGDDLSVTYDFYDEDGDSESLDTTIRWLKWSGSVFFDSGLRGKNLSSEYTLKGENWTCDVIPHDGLNEGVATRSNQNVTIGNTGPSVLNAVIAPSSPAADSVLVAVYDFQDPDSDLESGSTIRWYKDGTLQPGLNDSFSVDFTLTNGNDQWYYIITPSDGEDIGSPVQSVTVTIGNTPPEASNIAISPLNPDTSNDLSVSYDYYDYDGDLESLDTVVKWLRWSGSVFFDTGLRGKTLSSTYTSKGDIWTCDVIPHDGVEEGIAFRCSDNITIGNSVPTAENVKITPTIPDADSDLNAIYDYEDPDSDLESGSLIKWYKNDVEQVALQGIFSVDHSLTQKGEIWYYIITPSDGPDNGTAVKSDNVTIGNTAPSVSNIIISPASPTAEDDLSVNYDFYDSDGDSESLDTTIKWLRWNGAFYEDTGYRGKVLSAAYTSKGEIWKCEVRPHDGLDEGIAELSFTAVTITNSRPSASNAYITPDGAQTGSDLNANYDYTDLDSDLEVGTEIIWFRDGVHITELDNQFTVSSSYTAKDQIWNFSVRPSDGTDFGDYVDSENITIKNTKPTATDLTITPVPPRGDDNLVASYTFVDVDSDSEQSYEIRWFRNGIPEVKYNDLLTVDSSDTQKGEFWYFTVKVSDGTEESDTISSYHIQVENSKPILLNLTPDVGEINLEETDSFEFFVEVEDPDGDWLLIKWRIDKNTVSDSDYYKFETDYESAGTYVLNLTIQDLGDNSYTLSYEWTINVADINLPPQLEVQEPTLNNPKIREGDSQRFIIDKSDPDAEDIPQVTWYFNDGVAQTGGDSYTYAADDLASGDHVVKAVVDDGEDSVEYSWNLSVEDVVVEKEELMGLSYDAWGLIMAVISGLAAITLFLFGFYRVKKKKGALRIYMTEIDEISTTQEEDPMEYEYKLNEVEDKINSEFKSGHIEDLHYLMLQEILTTRRGEARRAEISEKFDRLPEGVMQNLDEMLKDGKISKGEYEGFVATISKTTALSPFEKKELSNMIEKWGVEDEDLPKDDSSDKVKPKKGEVDSDIDEFINDLED